VTRRIVAVAVAAVVVLALLVAVGRWEKRRAANKELAGMRTVVAAIGGNIVSPTLSGYRFGTSDCLAYHGGETLLALQLCFDQDGRLVQAVDRRGSEPQYYSLEYEPSLSTIRFPRATIDKLLQVAVAPPAPG
jgi:hypothetical protein